MAKHEVKIPENMLLYPRLGIVKKVDDEQRMGRLWVWIPEFTSLPDDENGWILCNYCSPFAGSTPREDTEKESIEAFESTQQSYGFWAVPPDIGNEIIIIFPNGHLKNAIWIGAVFKEFGNKMVPGVPADDNNFVDNGKKLPVAEYNKHQRNITDPLNLTRPGHTTRIDGISKQGLIGDDIRGITTSSAQRESPSEVFGLLTPGPRNAESGKRTGGSSFVMDDAIGSEHITLMTKSGAKIKIDETNELIYIINKPGTAWVQLDKDGNVDIFGAKNISMRAQGDLDLRADGDINIEAGNNVNIKAAKDTSNGEIVGEGKGDGGIVNIEANVNVESLATTGHVRATSASGDVILFAEENVKITSKLDTLITSEEAIVTQAKSDIRITSTEESLTLFAAKNLKGSADGDLIFTSAGAMGIETKSTLDIKSSGFKLDGDGNISNDGDIKTAGKCSATDYSADIALSQLAEHNHEIKTGSSTILIGELNTPTGTNVATLATPESLTPVSPVNIDPVTGTEAIEQVAKLNILVDFEDDRKYKRKSAIISTIVDRFITFEPCPEHEDFRLADDAVITSSVIPGTSLASIMAAVSATGSPALSLDEARKAIILRAAAQTGKINDVASVVNDALKNGAQ